MWFATSAKCLLPTAPKSEPTDEPRSAANCEASCATSSRARSAATDRGGPDGLSQRQDALDMARASTIAFIVGGAAIAGGAGQAPNSDTKKGNLPSGSLRGWGRNVRPLAQHVGGW